jgi:hypothetical protein
MAEFRDMAPRDLENALRDVGAHLRYPEERDLSRRVGTRVRSGAAGPRPFARRPFGRALGAAMAAAVLIAAAIAVASPAARRAVAGWLGIAGISILDEAPPGRLVPDDLALGRRVTEAEAEARAGFELRTPSARGLEEPDEIYLSEALAADVVTAVYGRRAELSPMGETQVAILITELEAGVEDAFVHKVRASGVEVRPVVVAGARGYWIEGPHTLLFATDDEVVEYRSRLAGNTLIWEKGPLSLRLESTLDLPQALRIARSM